jgi:hydroxymethylglutaryl-CoA lyase
MLPDRLRLVEVGPRDGLQNESAPIPTEAKLAFIRGLIDAGLREIEATSFVHPKAVPQLADADELARRLPSGPGVAFSALTPNERGLDRALQAGIRRIAVFTAASETFTQKNIGMTIEESLRVFKPLIGRAASAGVSARAYISTCFVCPYEGRIPKEKVAPIVERLLEMGADEVAISDTIGAAVPTDVADLLQRVYRSAPVSKLALHFHNTYGTALANVYAGLQLGVTTFDGSAGGLGGCPFAPGASGNVATEDLVYMFEEMGIATGVNLAKIVDAAEIIGGHLGRKLTGSAQYVRLRSAECQKQA